MSAFQIPLPPSKMLTYFMDGPYLDLGPFDLVFLSESHGKHIGSPACANPTGLSAQLESAWRCYPKFLNFPIFFQTTKSKQTQNLKLLRGFDMLCIEFHMICKLYKCKLLGYTFPVSEAAKLHPIYFGLTFFKSVLMCSV